MEVFTLASSSSGNCAIVSHKGTHILIDAGISLRRIKEGLSCAGLSPDDLDGVLVTHAHTDHINGIKMLTKYHKTPVFSSWGTCGEICRAAPETEAYISCFEAGVEFELGDIAVRSFRTPHDAEESVGYSLTAGAARMVYATDLGSVTEEIMNAALGAEIAVIEANHDRDLLRYGSYPGFLKKRITSGYGHLSNRESGSFAARLAASGARYILLAHLSRENNTPALARDTVLHALSEAGAAVGTDVELDVAPPDRIGRRYVI